MRALLITLALLAAPALAWGQGIAAGTPTPSCTLASCNTNSAAGYQLGNTTTLNAGTAALDAGNAPWTAVGKSAGQNHAAGDIFGAFFGAGAAQFEVGGHETAALGAKSCNRLNGGDQVSCLGMGSLSWEIAGTALTGAGGDSGRNVVGGGTSAWVGTNAGYSGAGQNIFAGGFGAVHASASSVTIGGTVFANGDTVALAFSHATTTFTGAIAPNAAGTFGLLTVTSPSGSNLWLSQVVTGAGVPANTKIVSLAAGTTGGAGTYLVSAGAATWSATVASESMSANYPGFPVTLTYTLGAGESANTIAAGLRTLFNANGNLGANGLADFSAVANSPADNTIGFMWPGTGGGSGTGYNITITPTIGGTGNETVTVGTGFAGANDNCIGSLSCYALGGTTFSFVNNLGGSSFGHITIGQGDNNLGHNGFPNLTTGNYNTGTGHNNGNGCITCSYNVFQGYLSGNTYPIAATSVWLVCLDQSGCSTPSSDPSNVWQVQGNSTTMTLYAAHMDSINPGFVMPGNLVIGGGSSAIGSAGSTFGNMDQGEFAMWKTAANTDAAGANGAKFAVQCGTNAGTAKFVMKAGTSNTYGTILDNVGTGVTGC